MALYPKTALSLFSGYGGLDLGLEMATGCRTVCYVERESFAASILVARMEEAALGQAPVWDDVTTFDGGPWRGVVDCVVGGSPCQDLSVAGKRAGITGERSGLWKQMRRIVEQTGTAFVFWENVGGAINTALDLVSEDLEGLGYRTTGCVIEASDVGAPHERRRLFVLAHAECDGRFWNGREDPARRMAGGHSVKLKDQVLAWCTPTASDGDGCGPREAGKLGARGHSVRLEDQVFLWPTPTAVPYGKNKSASLGAANRPSLNSIAAHWPTPTLKGNDNRKGASKTSGDGLQTAARQSKGGGVLNPQFVEALMGLPTNWTNPYGRTGCGRSETE